MSNRMKLMKPVLPNGKTLPKLNKKELIRSFERVARHATVNAVRFSRDYLARQANGNIDPDGRDLEKECGYPAYDPDAAYYARLCARSEVADRVCGVYPDECWAVYPWVYETDDQKTTGFEQDWEALLFRINVWHYLHRGDKLSRRGRFAIVLMGWDDKAGLQNPIRGFDGTVTWDGHLNRTRGKPPAPPKLLYLQTYSEDLVQVARRDLDPNSPRFGQPLLYRVTITDPRAGSANEEQIGPGGPGTRIDVHWTRCIHLAEVRETSDTFATIPLRPVLNRILDLRKVLGGSGEMFWRGAFPGYSFETIPNLVEESEMDEDSVKEQFEAYANGLKRYLALTGVTAKALTPQMADPTNTVMMHLKLLCSQINVPLPVFLQEYPPGWDQSKVEWNSRLARRQKLYLNPWAIQPFVNRLLDVGFLRQPKSKTYKIGWVDLNAVSVKDQATIALKQAQALLQYVTSGAEVVFPPKKFFTMVMGLTDEQADSVVKEAKAQGKKFMTKQVWQQEAGNTPGTTGTNPDKQKGAGGQRNGLGKGKKPRRVS